MTEEAGSVGEGAAEELAPVDKPPSSTAPADNEDWQDVWRRRLEITATAVLALATILTAWSAFQSAKWSGLQSIAFAEAGAARTESTRADTRAGQQAQVDVAVFIQWLNAVNEDNRDGVIELPQAGATYQPTQGTLSGFIFDRMRDEFRPALDAWIATSPFRSPDAPPTPFVMQEYRLEAAQAADELLATSEMRANDARSHNQQADDYVLMAVIFASVLFFVGLSSKLKNPRSGVAILLIGIALFVAAAITESTFPIEI